MPTAVHLAAATLDQTVGDWSGNARRIAEVLERCRGTGVRLVVLPEMCISGYSLGDRLLMPGTLRRSWEVLEELLPCTRGLVAVLGLPVRHRDVLYDVAAVVADGRIEALVPKENLAAGDIQYENRWFSGWQRGRVEPFRLPDGRAIPFGSLLFEADGIGRFGVEICEDGWKGNRPGSSYALAGATVVCNPSASWFTLGKHAIRRTMVEQISREDHVVYCYASLLGCDATRAIFDGSVFVAADGRLLAEGDRFAFDRAWVLVDRVVDLESVQRARMEEGSWRQQVESAQRGELGAMPQLHKIDGTFGTSAPAPASAPYWLEGTAVARSPDPSLDWMVDAGLIPRFEPTDLPYLELELALAMGLREYRKKCGIPGFTLALSGGRDSAMVAVLVARMFRYDQPDLPPEALRAHIRERFTTAYLAMANSGERTRRAARELADELGTRHLEGDLRELLETELTTVERMCGVRLRWDEPAHDVPLQNVQARIRGGLIWVIANLNRSLLLATSNKSEAAVGYATMDGDTSGGLAPIADVPKSMVCAWLAWAARFHGITSLQEVVAIPATAELRPPDRGQTDEDDLMPFAVLDQLMYHFVQRGQDPLELFRTLWPGFAERYGGDPAPFVEHIERFVTLFCRAQWKRERFAISFRVTAFDLDPKTGFRFPPVQAPFTEELAELRLHLHGLQEGGLG